MTHAQIRFNIGDRLNVNGDIVVVHSLAANGDHNLLHVDDNRFELKTVAELLELQEECRIVRLPKEVNKSAEKRAKSASLPLDLMPTKARKQAVQNSWYLNEYIKRGLFRKTSSVLIPMRDEVSVLRNDPNPPSIDKLRRIIRIWEDQGCPETFDVRLLAPQYRQRGLGQRHFSPEVEQVVQDCLYELYLKREKESLYFVWLEILRRVKNMDTTTIDPKYLEGGRPRVPSLSTIQRIARAIPRDIRVQAHYGRGTRIRKLEPVIQGPRPERALERVELDSTTLDYGVVHYERGILLGRPVFTYAMCVATRCIPAWKLQFAKPGSTEIMQLLAMIMTPKTYVQKQYPDIVHPPFAWGKPEGVVVDHGAEFGSEATLSYLGDNIVNFTECPVGEPGFKAHIERGFRTLTKGLVQTIRGTTFSNTMERGDYKSEKLAFLDIKDMQWVAEKWINDIYHRTVHRELGMTPAQKWAELVKQKPPAIPSDPNKVKLLARRFAFRKLTREGIEFEGLKYCEKSRELRELLSRADQQRKVKFYYEVGETDGVPDMSAIDIVDWRNGNLVRVGSTNLAYTKGTTYRHHQVYKERARKLKKRNEAIAVEDLMERKHELRQMIKMLARRRKTNKRLEGNFGDNVIPEVVNELKNERHKKGKSTVQEDLQKTYRDVSKKPRKPKRPSVSEETRAAIIPTLKGSKQQRTDVARRGAALGIVSKFK